MVDWKKIAKANDLTPDEFKKEIFTIAACLGAIDLDERSATDDECMKFTTTGETGAIEIYIRYAQDA